jgi:predicted metalloprotease with PDZ domain
MIDYTVTFAAQNAHLIEVRLTIAAPDPQGQQLMMPRWLPGSYTLREFAKHVVNIDAFDRQQQPILLHKINSYTWQCAPTSGPITICYHIYAWDRSVRGAHVDDQHAFFDGACVFMQVVGQSLHPCNVYLKPPKPNWAVATTLAPIDIDAQGAGQYRAPNYLRLIDHPVEIGQFEKVEFLVKGIVHQIVISGHAECDVNRLAEDVRKICTTHIEFFGEAPFNQYLFLLSAVGQGYGGLEHQDCTALMCPRLYLPVSGQAPEQKSYQTLLGLFSHEYFHAWNVKAIKPAEFCPFDLTQPQYTDKLWLFEGITSYYDDLALVRSGLISTKNYFAILSEHLSRFFSLPGRQQQTLIESSYDTWIKFYLPDSGSPNYSISYYLKGALVALSLDLWLRQQSHGNHSLDEVMQQLWTEHGQLQLGVTNGDIEQALLKVGGAAILPFLQQMLTTTEDWSFAQLLQTVGLTLSVGPIPLHKELLHAANETEQFSRLAWKLSAASGGLLVNQIYRHSAAEQAGMAPGDLLIAINGLKVDEKNYLNIMQKIPLGQEISLQFFREERLVQRTVRLTEYATGAATITVDPKASLEQVRHREQWLNNG